MATEWRRDVAGVPIRLPDERWRHVETRHPEMTAERERVLETLERPDYVVEGDHGTLIAVRQYQMTSLGEKHCMVVYRRAEDTDGFVVTAYLAGSVPSWRHVVWSR